ncbi:glycosyltransferase family 2 protein [uncultured Alistipes sp.]|uniref:glycosyltransferase family 2 protein n=1 Tax=uncultured Alistipes sp. TaxID=538949 RepID=UPI0025EA98A1|nr:glycosyltransferase family 2 protein [uncultured Alistipes sp.]
MIRLSLIIPTHNRASQLIAALESVVRQDLPAAEWECVVVSNNSTDDTLARFDLFAARYPGLNLRIVTEDGPGVSYARNRGIAETSTPLMVFIDDDERVNEGFLSAYARFFDTYPSVVVAGGRIIAEYVSGRPSWLSKYTEMPIANPMDFGPRVRPFPAGRVPGGGNMAFRRSAVERYGGFDPSLGRVGRMLIGGEENDFFERMMRGGEACWYVPDAVMWHIIPPEKLTESYFRRLCYNVGVSQRVRAAIYRRYPKTVLFECMKWVATLLMTLTMSPRKSLWLIRMRYEISRGIFSAPLPQP